MTTRILTHFAKAISIIFHPLLLPSYAVAIIVMTNPYMFSNLESTNKLRMLLIVLINTFVFPVIAIFLLKKLNFISSFDLEKNQDRHIPLISTSLFFFWSYLVFSDMPISPFLPDVLLGASICVFASFFINIFFKISIHTLASGYLIGIAIALLRTSTYNLEFLLILAFIIAGLVGSARLYLKAHQLDEVASGYAVGIMCYMIIFYLV